MSPIAQGRDQIDVIGDDYLALSRLAMREVGPAAQTLGAFYKMCGRHRRTFSSQETIAQQAGLPPRAVRDHLPKLVRGGWLRSEGREQLEGRRFRRRTCTYALTDKAIEWKRPYGVLPMWVARQPWSWSERAIYSLLGAQWMLIHKVADNGEGYADDRMELSLATAERMTGLSRPSVIAGFRSLGSRGVVDRYDDGTVMLTIDFVPPPPPLASKKNGGVKPTGSALRARSTSKKDGGGGVKKTAVPSKEHGGTPVKKTAALLSVKRLSVNSCPQRTELKTFAAANATCRGLSKEGKRTDQENRQWSAGFYQRTCAKIGYTDAPDEAMEALCLAVARGQMDEQLVATAAQATHENQPDNPMGYFWTCIRNALKQRGAATPKPNGVPLPKPGAINAIASNVADSKRLPAGYDLEYANKVRAEWAAMAEAEAAKPYLP